MKENKCAKWHVVHMWTGADCGVFDSLAEAEEWISEKPDPDWYGIVYR